MTGTDYWYRAEKLMPGKPFDEGGARKTRATKTAGVEPDRYRRDDKWPHRVVEKANVERRHKKMLEQDD